MLGKGNDEVARHNKNQVRSGSLNRREVVQTCKVLARSLMSLINSVTCSDPQAPDDNSYKTSGSQL